MHRRRLVPFKHGKLVVLLLLPGGNDVVDEVAAGAVASVQHMLGSVARLLEEEGHGQWHHKGFRWVNFLWGTFCVQQAASNMGWWFQRDALYK